MVALLASCLAPELDNCSSQRSCQMGRGVNPAFHSQMSTPDYPLHQITWILVFWCSCDKETPLKKLEWKDSAVGEMCTSVISLKKSANGRQNGLKTDLQTLVSTSNINWQHTISPLGLPRIIKQLLGSSLFETRLEITFIKTSHSIQVLIQAPPGADHGATCFKGSKDTILSRLHETEALERWANQGTPHPLGSQHCSSGGGAWEAASSSHSSPAPFPTSQTCWQA